VKIISKLELMSYVIRGVSHECFEHSELGIFDVTEMRIAATKIGELKSVPIDMIAPFVMVNRVTEPARVMALDDASWKHDPGIMIVSEYDEQGVPTVTMVDGHHRALRRAIQGYESMDIWMIPLEKAIRPSPEWVKNPFFDWGEEIRDGQIIRGHRGG
jgi:hypothetical protein